MKRRAGLWACCVLLAGCLAQEDRGVGRSFDHAEAPRCWERARFLEDRALKTLRESNAREWTPRRKRELVDQAISDLREARDLYAQELADDPGTPTKQRILEDEFDRLSDVIDRTHDARPHE